MPVIKEFFASEQCRTGKMSPYLDSDEKFTKTTQRSPDCRNNSGKSSLPTRSAADHGGSIRSESVAARPSIRNYGERMEDALRSVGLSVADHRLRTVPSRPAHHQSRRPNLALAVGKYPARWLSHDDLSGFQTSDRGF